MIITTLVENTTISKEYKKKHGLCLHIKTREHSILFDVGPDDTFIKNTRKLNIDISDVDIVIISHGHNDHGGGLELFSNVKGYNLIPNSNKLLLKKEENRYIQDNFKHEQNLILKENNKYILIAGCLHCGITNIIETAEKIIGKNLDITIAGFHLFNPVSMKSESYEFIELMSEKLSNKNMDFLLITVQV